MSNLAFALWLWGFAALSAVAQFLFAPESDGRKLWTHAGVAFLIGAISWSIYAAIVDLGPVTS